MNSKQNDQGSQKPLISICIPVHNEASNIEVLYKRLDKLSASMRDKCAMEFIFSDNHSDDETWDILKTLAEKDTRIRAIRFSKNFGFQRSILANYLHARGDAVMQLDADLQDPPEMLIEFFDRWSEGYLVVYGIRRSRDEGVFTEAFRRVGYWIINKLGDHEIPCDAGDFRLMDKKIIKLLAKSTASNLYLRGSIPALGFKQIGIPYDRGPRLLGKSKFTVLKILNLGLTGILNHSNVPLRVSSFIGAVVLLLSFLGAIYYLALRLLHPDLPAGLASIHILVLFGIGLNCFLLGVIGEYLLRIYLLLRQDPIAIVEDSLNFESSELLL